MIATVESNLTLPAFAEMLFEPARYKVLYGGRGGGKSWAIARALLILAHQRPLRVLCTREHQVSIRDSVHRLLTDQIHAMGMHGAYQVTRGEIRNRVQGSVFLFEGLRHNIANIKSMEGVDIAWVEEAERISEASWKILIPTIRKEGSEIWVSFNPDQDDDPTYKRFIASPPDSAVVRKVGWRDNPWFPAELRAEMEHDFRVDPDAAAHVWGGECRKETDAQVLKGKWQVEEFEPEDSWDGPYHGADWGFANDPTVLVRCWIGNRTLYVEREAHKVGLELDDTAGYFQQHVPGCENYTIRSDSARPETISYLRRHGLPLVEAAPKWHGSVEDGVAHLRSYDRIVIHPRCIHTIKEARFYSYKVDRRTGDVLPEIADAWNHCIDAIRYALTPLHRQNQKRAGTW